MDLRIYYRLFVGGTFMTIARYTIGFILSLGLTLLAYAVVVYKLLDTWAVAALIALAIVQMIVQLIYFLHISDETGPRYKLQSFIYMASLLVFLVVGSLWIMGHLNYNMMNMSPEQKDGYMMGEKDRGF